MSKINFTPMVTIDEAKSIIGAIGDERKLDGELLESLPGVEQALHIVKPYKIVAREWHKEDTVIDISGVPLGGLCHGLSQEQTPAGRQLAATGPLNLPSKTG